MTHVINVTQVVIPPGSPEIHVSAGASLAHDGAQSLAGTGAVRLTGTSSVLSHGASGGGLTIGAGIVIDGQGTVGLAGGSWTNHGAGVNAGTIALCPAAGVEGFFGFTQSAAGLLSVEMAGTTLGTIGRVSINFGTIRIDGGLIVTPVNGFTPNPGDSAVFMDAGIPPILGAFANVNCIGFNGSIDDSSGNTVVLNVIP